MKFDEVKWQRCDGCDLPLQHELWTLGPKKICAACLARLKAKSGPDPKAMLHALLLGAGGAIAGAVLYWFVRVEFHIEIGILSIGVGYLVGHGVRWGAGDRSTRGLQIAAVVLTYLAITVQYIPDLAGPMQLEGLGAWLSAMPKLMAYAVAAPFSGGVRGVIGAIILAVALREAWRLTTPIDAAIKGPLAVGR